MEEIFAELAQGKTKKFKALIKEDVKIRTSKKPEKADYEYIIRKLQESGNANYKTYNVLIDAVCERVRKNIHPMVAYGSF